MIEPVLKAFEGLLSDFTWRRLTALVVLTLYIGLLFAAVEAVSGHFRLARVEHAANILSRLHEIESKQPPLSPQLAAIHADLVRKLHDINSSSGIVVPNFATLWKFIASAAPFFLMTVIFVSDIRKGKPGAWSGVLGLGFIAVVAGLTGILIPAFLWPWGNLLIYPIALFIVFGVFAVRWQKRKERRAAASQRSA